MKEAFPSLEPYVTEEIPQQTLYVYVIPCQAGVDRNSKRAPRPSRRLRLRRK